MTLPEPYKYKTKSPRPARMSVNRLQTPKEDEELTGWVHGQTAYATEERFARALMKKKIEFHFQIQIPTSTQFEDKELDFLVINGIGFPVEIDGDIGHKTEHQKAKDSTKEALVNEWAMRQGYSQLQRVPGSDLQTQDDADLVVGRLFG